MDTIPIHLLAPHLDKASKIACLETHAMFSMLFYDECTYSWHVQTPDLLEKYRCLKKRMPKLRTLKLYIGEDTHDSLELHRQLLQLSQHVKLQLDIRDNATFITNLLMFTPAVEISYLSVNFLAIAQLLAWYAPPEVVLSEQQAYPLGLVARAKNFKHIRHLMLMEYCHLNITQETLDQLQAIPHVYIFHKHHPDPPTSVFSVATMLGNINCDEALLPIRHYLEYAKHNRLLSMEINTNNMYNVVHDRSFGQFIAEVSPAFQLHIGCNATLCPYSITLCTLFLAHSPARKVCILDPEDYSITHLQEKANITACGFLLYYALSRFHDQVSIYEKPDQPSEHYLETLAATPHLYQTWKNIHVH